MQNKKLIIIGLVLLMAGAGLGRYATPARVEIKTEQVVIERIVEKRVYDAESKKKSAKKRQTHTIETTKPDGTVIKEVYDLDESTTFIEAREGETLESSNDRTEINKKDKTVKNEAKWKANGLAGLDIPRAAPVYGGQVEYRVFGPFFVGGFGLTTGVVGVSGGISF